MSASLQIPDGTLGPGSSSPDPYLKDLCKGRQENERAFRFNSV